MCCYTSSEMHDCTQPSHRICRSPTSAYSDQPLGIPKKSELWICGLIECFHMTSRRPCWCSKTMKRQPCWCPKLFLWELNSFLMQMFSFVRIYLHRCWPCEWKHSIVAWGPWSAVAYGFCWDSCLHAVCSQASQSHDTSVECNFYSVMWASQL